MKTITTVIIITLLSSCAAYTPYTKQEWQWIGGMWTACSMDIYQTQQIDESDKFDEGNSIVEKNLEFALVGVPLILTIGALWMEPKDRGIWFKTFTGVKSAAVAYNYEKGVR